MSDDEKAEVVADVADWLASIGMSLPQRAPRARELVERIERKCGEIINRRASTAVIIPRRGAGEA